MKLRRTRAALLAAACAICASARTRNAARPRALGRSRRPRDCPGRGAGTPLPDGSVPLAWASELQDETAVHLLLDHGADTNGGANAFSPLLVACLHPDADVLDALISAGAHVDARSREDVPVLSICAGRAPTAIVERLLDAGAPVDATDAAGQTALMWAAAHSRQDTFALLLARGAAISATTGRAHRSSSPSKAAAARWPHRHRSRCRPGPSQRRRHLGAAARAVPAQRRSRDHRASLRSRRGRRERPCRSTQR